MAQEPILGFLVHICKMLISPSFFVCLYFFKILILSVFNKGGGGGGKRAKKRPIITNFNLSDTISQELQIISPRCQVQRCKIMISLGVFFYYDYFLKNYNILSIKILAFFVGRLHYFLLRPVKLNLLFIFILYVSILMWYAVII